MTAYSELTACLPGPDCNTPWSVTQMLADQRTLILPQGLLPEGAAHPQLWYCCGMKMSNVNCPVHTA